MTNLREAAQMALDALEKIQIHPKSFWDCSEEIKALRTALAQPIEPDYSKAGFGKPQPEPEPVAAALRHAAQVVQLYDDACFDDNYMLDSNDCEGILNALADYYDAGYTAAPRSEPVIDKSMAIRIATQLGWEPKKNAATAEDSSVVREWQGLTDEEREEATGWSVEHIEAKLREKNGA